MRDPYKAGIITQTGQFRGYGWFYIPQWNITIAAPPKGGSSSLKQFMANNEIECYYIPHNQVTGDVYFVVRNPLDRFASLWKSKCRDKANISNKQVHGMAPWELMSYIESGAKDVHWTPQTMLIGNLTPTLIPLDSFDLWWDHNGFGELGKFNATEGEVEISESLKNKVLTFYAEDVILYARAEMNSN